MIVKFIIYIGSFIIYWSVTAMVLTAVSPILFLALMLQPFAETGILKLFTHIYKSWTDMARDINDPAGAQERKEIADAEKRATQPPAKPKDFYDSFDYISRKTYMDIGEKVSYHPDKDPERSDIVTPVQA